MNVSSLIANDRRRMATLFVLTVTLRLALASVASHTPLYGNMLAPGSDGYEKIARHLLEGDGYRVRTDLGRTMLRSPGYVLLLTAMFAVGGDNPIILAMLQAVSSGAIVLLMYYVGARVVGTRAAFLGALAYALYPADWLASLKYVAEPLLGLLLLLTVLASRVLVSKPSVRSAALLGLCVGLLGLTKSVCVFMLPCLLVVLLWLGPHLRQSVSRFLQLSAVAAAVNFALLLPWAYANYHESGHWVFTSTVVGWALFDGNYVYQHRHSKTEPADLWVESRDEARKIALEAGITPDPRDEWLFGFFDVRDEYALGELLKHNATHWILHHPAAYAHSVIQRLAAFWYAGRSHLASRLGALLNIPPLVIATVGFIRRRLYRGEAVFWLAIVFYLNFLTAMSFAVARYSLPVMPFILLMAAAALVSGEFGRSDSGENARTESATKDPLGLNLSGVPPVGGVCRPDPQPAISTQ